MLVIAFDGILYDTFFARERAIFNALTEDIDTLTKNAVRETVFGQSIGEAVRQIAHQNEKFFRDSEGVDETAIDLAVMRAEYDYAELAGHGFSLNFKTYELLHRAASVTRIVVRADSKRREVEFMIKLAGLESAIAMIHCSDDPPLTTTPESATSTTAKSYDRIAEKLAANKGLLGEKTAVGVAMEVNERARTVARKFGFETPADISAVRFPGI